MSGWIGVDLDGTLAEYHGWLGPLVIGKPIEPMVARVKQWLAEGKDVRIFTARVFENRPEIAVAIQKWSHEHIGEVLPITCIKDYGMIELWDDRAVQIVTNTGLRADGKSDALVPEENFYRDSQCPNCLSPIDEICRRCA